MIVISQTRDVAFAACIVAAENAVAAERVAA